MIYIHLETTFEKNLTLFMIKTWNKLGIEENLFIQIKGIYEKPRCNIILNSEEPEVFLSRSGKDNNVCPHHFYSHCTGRSIQGN
jgi:hypothetical protein